MANWVSAHNHPDYRVSKSGKVKRVSPGQGAQKGRVLQPREVSGGYHGVTLNSEQWLLHRLIWESFYGEIKDAKQINHIDGDKKNNKLANLEVVTPSENCRHAHENDLIDINCGENTHKSKLTNEQASAIRERYAQNDETQKEIAQDFGVNQSVISRILNNKRYTNERS